MVVPQGVERFFGRLIRAGRDPSMRPSEARYVVLTNIVALLGFVFSLAFAPILFLSGHAIYPALQVVYAIVYLPTLWLNHRRHHGAATTWLLLGSQLCVFSQVLFEGRGFDVHMFFYLHAALPFMVCAPHQTGRMLALSALAGFDLFAVSWLGHHIPQLGPPIDAAHVHTLRAILLFGLFGTLASCAWYARRATLIAEAALDRAHARSEELLLNILPPSIANRLKACDGTIADGFAEVTVLFADIVGFTTMSSRMPPTRVVEMLNTLFCSFDDLAGQLRLEKIKTIGDCYMVAGGLPEPRTDHADAVADMALGMLRIVKEFGERIGEPLQVRIGLHSGPVVAGVIGKRKFIYDLWGDTVNVASRMESHGLPGAVQVSEAAQRLLEARYRCTDKRTIHVKGKGEMDAWLLAGPRVGENQVA